MTENIIFKLKDALGFTSTAEFSKEWSRLSDKDKQDLKDAYALMAK